MTTDLSLLRSLLFVPATKLEKLSQVAASRPDLIVIDLEDSIAPDLKDDMRDAVARFFDETDLTTLPAPVGVRINNIRSLGGLEDMLAFLQTETLPDALMLPKIRSVEELDLLADWMEDVDRVMPVIPLFETLSVWDDADAIMAHDLVPCGVFGGIDLAAELGSDTSWDALHLYRSLLLRAARRSDKGCLDMPWFHLDDSEGLRSETHRLQAMGFDGRAAIHPNQIPVIHACLQPDEAAVAGARAMIEAFEQAGSGVAVYRGKVLEKPVLMHAYKLLERAARNS